MSSNETAIEWHIGPHVASAMISDTPVLQRGETVSLRFLFRGGTIHDDESMHEDWTMHGDLQAHYAAARERLEYTDAAVKRGVAHNGVPWIRERLPARASVDSQVVLVQPGADVLDVEAFWAAVVGGSTDNRPKHAGGDRWITLELFVLAEFGEYMDSVEGTYGGQYGGAYGVRYQFDREDAREALLDDLGGEVV